MTNNNQTAPVTDEELDQMILKLERDGGMAPKMLSLMREIREVRRAKEEPVAWTEKCEITNMQATGLYLRSFPDNSQGREIPLYTVPPAPVVSEVNPQVSEVKTLVSEVPTDDERIMEIEGIAHPAPVAPDLKELEAILGWILMLPCPTPKATHFAMRLAVVIEACRAAMLQPDGTLTNEDTMQLSGNSEQPEPVSNRDELPDGYCAMPLKLTAENGAKGALSGEFHVSHRIVCQSCGGEGCEDCNDEGGWDGEIPISWDTIKLIHQAAVEACALPAVPQEQDAMTNQSKQVLDMVNSPATSDGWKLVPEEPTHEMLEAGDAQFGTYDVYRRMIEAVSKEVG